MKNIKIKILFFHFDLGNGGAERVLVNLANGLDPDKYEIEIRTLFDYGPNKALINDNVKYTSVFKIKPFRGISKLLLLLKPSILHKLFITGRYDVEIAFREGCPSRIISGGNPGIPKYSWIHTTFKTEKLASCGYRGIKEFRICSSKFKKIATVSGAVCDSVREVLPDFTNIGVVYNVVDPSVIRERAKESIEDIRLDNGKTVNMISVGRLTQVKSFDRLLCSLKKIKDKGYINWHLYIIGVGELEESLKKLTLELGLQDDVTFLGYQDNPHKYVAKMDLFVCSSYREGYSTAVSEAIINSVPVLTTECSGMSEILGETEAGMIVENSEEGIIDGLENILSDASKLSRMKADADDRSAFFSKEYSISQFEKFVLDD